MNENEKINQEAQSRITKGLESAFESVVNERNEYYQKNPTYNKFDKIIDDINISLDIIIENES